MAAILFLEDWKKYNYAIIDTQTKNESFLELAKLYKKMGVENHGFILSLINPDLQGVDPHSPLLSQKMMEAVAFEAKINPWYWLRECARIPGKVGSDPIPVRANRGIIAQWWLFFNHITPIVIQPRQTGKSTGSDLLAVYLLNIRCKDTTINLLTKDETLRQENIKKIKDTISVMPGYLIQRTKKDLDNTEQISIKRMNNYLRAHVPQADPKAANNLGRGLTSPIFFIDEAPFQKNIGYSMPAAVTAGVEARDIARRTGEPYGTILTTTAGKKDDKDSKIIYKMLTESLVWTEKLFDCVNLAHLEETIIKNSPSKKLMVNCTFNHRQLGRDDEWLKRVINEIPGITPEQIDRDFLNIWTSGSETHPLSIKVLEAIQASKKLDPYIDLDHSTGFITKWYIPFDQRHSYFERYKCVLGCDPSEAQGGDPISLIVVNSETGEVVAAGNYNETNTAVFARWLAKWFINYRTLVGVIERRSAGSTIMDIMAEEFVVHGIDIFKTLFNRVVNDKDEQPERYQEICTPLARRNSFVYIDHKKHVGFSTSGSGLTSRGDLYGVTLQNAAKTIGPKLYDLTTIEQISKLTSKNNRVDHQNGEHDDMVIAWLLCYWFITNGRNLKHYGFDTNRILVQQVNYTQMTGKQVYDHFKQSRIKERINTLCEKIKHETSDHIIEIYERELKLLNKDLVLQEGESFVLDDVIKKLKDAKKNNRQQVNNNTPGSRYINAYSDSGYVTY